MLEDLNKKYDKLQKKYGDINLNPIYNGGCTNNPDICFVFMNPTGKNVASSKTWNGLKAPWLGTKNIWDLFYQVNLLDEDIYQEIRKRKPKDWDERFSEEVYQNVTNHKYFIINMGEYEDSKNQRNNQFNVEIIDYIVKNSTKLECKNKVCVYYKK